MSLMEGNWDEDGLVNTLAGDVDEPMVCNALMLLEKEDFIEESRPDLGNSRYVIEEVVL